eukprot:COSAG02_NODE_2875_length_7843_cov_877.610795_4_plen_320_part_00
MNTAYVCVPCHSAPHSGSGSGSSPGAPSSVSGFGCCVCAVGRRLSTAATPSCGVPKNVARCLGQPGWLASSWAIHTTVCGPASFARVSASGSITAGKYVRSEPRSSAGPHSEHVEPLARASLATVAVTAATSPDVPQCSFCTVHEPSCCWANSPLFAAALARRYGKPDSCSVAMACSPTAPATTDTRPLPAPSSTVINGADTPRPRIIAVTVATAWDSTQRASTREPLHSIHAPSATRPASAAPFTPSDRTVAAVRTGVRGAVVFDDIDVPPVRQPQVPPPHGQLVAPRARFPQAILSQQQSHGTRRRASASHRSPSLL